jgi:ABC-type branched-subunit amino acid transport system ATPase component
MSLPTKIETVPNDSAHTAVVLDRGKVVHRGKCAKLRGDQDAQARLLGMGDESEPDVA